MKLKFGNIQTCTVQGFFVQLGTVAPLYNLALCILYICIVRYKIRDKTLINSYVPVVHIVIMGFIIFTAFYALAKDLFNDAGIMGCLISEVKPDKCADHPKTCGRGKHAKPFEI